MERRKERGEGDKVALLEYRIGQLESQLRFYELNEKRRSRDACFARTGLVSGLILMLYIATVGVWSQNKGAEVNLTGETSSSSASETPVVRTVSETPGGAARLSKHDDGSLVRHPTKVVDGEVVELSLSERLRLLEVKTLSRNNWLTDPSLSTAVTKGCKKRHRLDEHFICFDYWDPKRDGCVVYDFGIRRQPAFGRELALKYGCEVHAFDPSPISTEDTSWIENNGLDVPNYHFHPYGVGGTDGEITLYEYNWGQVSPIVFPPYIIGPCANNTLTSENKFEPKCKRASLESKSFTLPVKTLPTIMKELNHTFIHIMKLDVEGSEFSFLEQAIDHFGCLPANQLSIEWHHYTFDQRYGGKSSPEMNSIIAPLHLCGFKVFQRDYLEGGFPDDAKFFYEMGITLRYTTTSHMLVPEVIPYASEEYKLQKDYEYSLRL